MFHPQQAGHVLESDFFLCFYFVSVFIEMMVIAMPVSCGIYNKRHDDEKISSLIMLLLIYMSGKYQM